MKITDIKPGKEYALAQRYGDPRKVKALGIVIVEDQMWSNTFERFVARNVRQVEIEYLDNGVGHRSITKGSKAKVKARSLVAPWSEIGPGIQKRAAEEQAQDNMTKELEKRVKKLLGRNYDGYILVRNTERPQFDVNGKSFLKMLELAEKGAANG